MSFEIRKTSDCGTKHPVVARLKVQTRELLSWADLSGDGQTAVVALYYGLAERLIKCHESYGRLFENLKAAIEEFQPKPGSRLRSVPYVIGLTGGVETFLYESKNFLRDLLGVFNIFFGVKFEEASAFFHPKRNGVGKLVKWATKTFGASDELTEMLASEEGWIVELISKRNAAEHPGGYSGTLYIENIKSAEHERFILPTWRREESPPTDIFADLETCLDNMLTLAEEILTSCIMHKTVHQIIQFAEIPSGDRNPNCPMRLIVQLDKAKIKSPS